MVAGHVWALVYDSSNSISNTNLQEREVQRGGQEPCLTFQGSKYSYYCIAFLAEEEFLNCDQTQSIASISDTKIIVLLDD